MKTIIFAIVICSSALAPRALASDGDLDEFQLEDPGLPSNQRRASERGPANNNEFVVKALTDGLSVITNEKGLIQNPSDPNLSSSGSHQVQVNLNSSTTPGSDGFHSPDAPNSDRAPSAKSGK